MDEYLTAIFTNIYADTAIMTSVLPLRSTKHSEKDLNSQSCTSILGYKYHLNNLMKTTEKCFLNL